MVTLIRLIQETKNCKSRSYGALGIALVSLLALVSISDASTLTCSACSQVIKSEYVRADGEYFHPEHFVCAYCAKPIDGDYSIYERMRYHKSCYK